MVERKGVNGNRIVDETVQLGFVARQLRTDLPVLIRFIESEEVQVDVFPRGKVLVGDAALLTLLVNQARAENRYPPGKVGKRRGSKV